jgi:uncharacterized membrane protein YoaK (UPF0700 family)
MKLSLPLFLSANGGYVDTAGYLALQGLFTSHVTGNFVTLGAALVLGTSGVVAKLLALPMFCLMVFATRLLSLGLPALGWPALRSLLSLQLLLLVVGAGLAIDLGPFRNGDGWQALVTGMTLVAAMAIQNAIHRIHLSASPPTTIMTGNTTQIMLDLADLTRRVSQETRVLIKTRLGRMWGSVAAFAAGCAAAALLYHLLGVWCFVVPPIVGLCIVCLPEAAPRPVQEARA